MSVEFCGLELAHPIVNGSGTFDALAARRAFGAALDEQFPFAAYVSKTITLEPRAGNPPPRLWETPAGLINSIGLPNKGLAGYLAEDLPELASLPVPLITNVMGSSAAEIAELVQACDAYAEIAAIELNVSCPNVKTGLDIGADPRQLEQVVRTVRERTSKPSDREADAERGRCRGLCGGSAGGRRRRGVADQHAARARARAGIPRWPGCGRGAEPWLGGRTGGLSGPAIRAVALAQVAAVATRVEIPAIGMGGVSSATHARELLDVGARLVAVGTASFRDPTVGARIARELDFPPAPVHA